MAKKAAQSKKESTLVGGNEALKAVLAKLEKDHGKGVIQPLAGTTGTCMPKWERQIPTGSIGLDIALGTMFRRPNGRWQTGYGPGRIIEMYGGEGSGKTTQLGLLIANAQAMGIACAVADMEHRWDLPYMRRLGVQLDKLWFYQPSSGEQCLQIADTLVKSGQFGVVGVDSVAALVTEGELKGDVGDSHVAEQARLMASTLRSVNTYLTQGSKTTLVFTNQLRDKIGGYGGSTTPGGRALKFYATNRIEIVRIGLLGDGDEKFGQKVKFTVVKNSSAPPFRFAETDLVWGVGFDCYAELIDLCVGRGILTVNGAWFYNGKKPLGQGRRNAADAIREDPALAYHLYDQLLTAVVAEWGYTPEGDPLPGFVEPHAPSVVQTLQQQIPGAPTQTPGAEEAVAEESPEKEAA